MIPAAEMEAARAQTEQRIRDQHPVVAEQRIAAWRAKRPAVAEPAHVAKEAQGAARDGCELCGGKRGGVPGNENLIGGKRVCDYCHATPPAPASPAEPSEREQSAASIAANLLNAYAKLARDVDADDVNIPWIERIATELRAPAPVAVTREPLCDDQILTIASRAADKCHGFIGRALYVAREVERAHGIAASPAGAEGAGS